MLHSIKEIGEMHEKLSIQRRDIIPFISSDFIEFAEANLDKYYLDKVSGDLKVSSWYVDTLVNDFKLKIGQKIG